MSLREEVFLNNLSKPYYTNLTTFYIICNSIAIQILFFIVPILSQPLSHNLPYR